MKAYVFAADFKDATHYFVDVYTEYMIEQNPNPLKWGYVVDKNFCVCNKKSPEEFSEFLENHVLNKQIKYQNCMYDPRIDGLKKAGKGKQFSLRTIDKLVNGPHPYHPLPHDAWRPLRDDEIEKMSPEIREALEERIKSPSCSKMGDIKLEEE
ncbi:hypothetical protein KY358_02100 [Candidatus Woesearchaeota archaeon]|nr:hypothetical protein [Candidatus Woesearchaeota archaeon]